MVLEILNNLREQRKGQAIIDRVRVLIIVDIDGSLTIHKENHQ